MNLCRRSPASRTARSNVSFTLDEKGISRLIPAINRELTLDRAFEFLDLVLPFRSEKVIGIGLDYDEEPFPPAPFKPVYDRAKKAGMRLTAHAGEGGPAANVRDALDLLSQYPA